MEFDKECRDYSSTSLVSRFFLVLSRVPGGIAVQGLGTAGKPEASFF